MSRIITKVAAATALTLVAGLGVTGSAGPASGADESCQGAAAPENTNTVNQAPVLQDDTVSTMAGRILTIKVLANDSDPDSDKLYVASATQPERGELCLHKNGTIDYLAMPSAYNRTDTFSYGVTDGDRYRTAKVTVNIEGIKPMRPVLKQRLVLKKHSKQVKQWAVMTFTNPNKNRMLLYAGNPKKERPSVQRVLYPGRSFTMTTKLRRVQYVTALAPRNDDLTLVNVGLLNTRNGHLRGVYLGIYFGDEFASEARATRELWARRNG